MMINKTQENRIFSFFFKKFFFFFFLLMFWNTKADMNAVRYEQRNTYMNIFTWNKDIKILDVIQNDFYINICND